MPARDVPHEAFGAATNDDVIGADGVHLKVWRSGSGPPVLLLHGFPEDHRAWRHQIGPLNEAGFSTLVPDLRGYGASEKPAGVQAYRLRKLVEDVASIARAAGQSVHLVGHDWGGVIAWEFAARHPELLHRLVILNAPHPALYWRALWRSSQLLKSWYALCFQLPWLPEPMLSACNHRLLRAIYRLGTAQKDAFTDQEIDDYVAAFRQPGALTAALNYYRASFRSRATRTTSGAKIETSTLVIWGERDPALSVTLLDGLPDVARNITVQRLAEAGHFVQHESTETVNRLLLDFLRA